MSSNGQRNGGRLVDRNGLKLLDSNGQINGEGSAAKN